MIKRIKLLNSTCDDVIIEKETEINNKIVWNIDTSELIRDRLIVLNDENHRKISEILIPSDMIVVVDYID